MRAAGQRPWSWAATLAAAVLLARAATAADINWADVEKEAADFLRAYIQIDTSNPPGNEIEAARFIADRFHCHVDVAYAFQGYFREEVVACGLLSG